jgi:hypothetical protein
MEGMGCLILIIGRNASFFGGWHVPHSLRQSNTVLCLLLYICKKGFIETIKKLCPKIQILLIICRKRLYYTKSIENC